MKNTLAILFPVFSALLPGASQAKSSSKPATAIFFNGRILHGTKNIGSALAVVDDRILQIGRDQKIKTLVGPDTRIVDLKGGTVLPGLIDSHIHLLNIGEEKRELDLSRAKSEAEVTELVAKRIAESKKGAWIIGHGWDQNKWPGKAMPSLETLDKVAANNPVVLSRIDGHAAWVNTSALKEAGISRETSDPSGGKILRDKTGQPLGILLESAQSQVYKKVPPPSKEQVLQALREAIDEVVANGLTSVHAMSVTRLELEALEELAKNGQLPLRVSAFLSAKDSALANEWLKAGPKISSHHHRLTVRGFKYFADGALGSRGAALLSPYADGPENSGVLTTDKAELVAFGKKAISAGFQLATHAIGDKANRLVLDAYEEIFRDYPSFKSPRFRVEHAQIVEPSDIPRFAHLGVVAAMQATHCTSDMPWVNERIGEKRASGGAYPWKALLKHGARIANGSDAPVESPNPFLGIYAAVTRQDVKDQPTGGWLPQNKMSLAEALRSFTLDAAYASFDEELIGSLETGKLADFVVIKEKIDAIPFSAIRSIRPSMTVVGGEIVYSADRNCATTP